MPSFIRHLLTAGIAAPALALGGAVPAFADSYSETETSAGEDGASTESVHAEAGGGGGASYHEQEEWAGSEGAGSSSTSSESGGSGTAGSADSGLLGLGVLGL